MKYSWLIYVLILTVLVTGCQVEEADSYEGYISLDEEESVWFEEEFNESNALHRGIILCNHEDNFLSTHVSFIPKICNPSYGRFLLPVGAEYIDEMAELAIDRKLFEEELMSAITIISGMKVMEACSETAYVGTVDSNPVLQEMWLEDFRKLMAELASGDIGKFYKYGIFILPHIRENINSDPVYYEKIINETFNKETYASFETANTAKGFMQKNKKIIDTLEEVIIKYGN